MSSTRIPALVKKNTVFLASYQALSTSAIQLIPTLSALILVEITGNVAVAGLGGSILSAARVIVSYPAGKIADRYGRRLNLLAASALGLVGAVAISYSTSSANLSWLLASLLLFSLGMGVSSQARVAAADMYPKERRGEGLGYILTGSLIGSFGGLFLITLSKYTFPQTRLEELSAPWLLVPLFSLPAMAFVLLTRPDPLEIARNKSRYYKDSSDVEAEENIVQERRGSLISLYPVLRTIAGYSICDGVMVMVMSLNALVLTHHGYSVTFVSLSVALHVVGMFAFSVPLGRLGDRFGRKKIMLFGLAAGGIGALVNPLSSDYLIITGSLFLVGVGWCAANIASTSVFSDVTRGSERASLVGLNDTVASLFAISLPAIGGALMGFFGLVSMGFFALLLASLGAIITLPIKELKPGSFVRQILA